MTLKKNMDEILINKQTTINRCIKRIQEDYQDDFRENFTRQDSVILNIERACQTAIDMGNRIIKLHNLGLPQSNRDTFIKLEKSKIISPELSSKMQSMAGFRNLAVHDYGSINLDIVINIVENNLDDLKNFAETVIAET
ncbi:MAG: type VII toxin-antitoxin system HepT family RNase toxin [Bacteroidota bacterium]